MQLVSDSIMMITGETQKLLAGTMNTSGVVALNLRSMCNAFTQQGR